VINVGIGWLCGLLFGVWRLMTSVPEFHWESPRAAARHARETLRFGGPMQLTNLFAVLHSQVDKFLLPRFAGLAAVTPFELGMRVVVAAAAPAQLLVSAVLPAAAELHTAEAHARLHDLHVRARRYVLVIGFVSMAVLMGLADRLLTTWLGPGHDEAALAMRGLAAGIGLSFTTNVAAIVARGIGRTDLEAWFTGAVFRDPSRAQCAADSALRPRRRAGRDPGGEPRGVGADHRDALPRARLVRAAADSRAARHSAAGRRRRRSGRLGPRSRASARAGSGIAWPGAGAARGVRHRGRDRRGVRLRLSAVG
jgi:hypothetical protein